MLHVVTANTAFLQHNKTTNAKQFTELKAIICRAFRRV